MLKTLQQYHQKSATPFFLTQHVAVNMFVHEDQSRHHHINRTGTTSTTLFTHRTTSS